jgi:hypothetical protein
MIESIIEGSIYLKPNFLGDVLFKGSKNLLDNLEYDATYQPSEVYYGNRFQAYPCYQTIVGEDETKVYKKELQRIIDRDFDLRVIARKVLSKELIKSKVNTKYGLVHSDSNADIAGILYFDQSVSGGTAFFEHEWDKEPDIVVGAYPNRLLMYNAKRPHAPCQDFTFDERKILAFFITL